MDATDFVTVFTQSLDLFKDDDKHQLYHDLMRDIKEAIKEHVFYVIKDEDCDNESPLLEGADDDGRYFDIKVTSEDGKWVVFRISLVDLYLIGFKTMDNEWYYFEKPEHVMRFNSVFKDKSHSLGIKGDYWDFDEYPTFSFKGGDFNEYTNFLANYDLEKDLQKEFKKAVLFFIFALPESIRFPSVRCVMERALNPKLPQEDSPSHALTGFGRFMMGAWVRSSDPIVCNLTHGLREGDKKLENLPLLPVVKVVGEEGRFVTLADIDVLKIKKHRWDKFRLIRKKNRKVGDGSGAGGSHDGSGAGGFMYDGSGPGGSHESNRGNKPNKGSRSNYNTKSKNEKGWGWRSSSRSRSNGNCLVFAETDLVQEHDLDLFYTRIAPSRTCDSLTDEFSCALMLITITVTWVMSERKELNEKWRYGSYSHNPLAGCPLTGPHLALCPNFDALSFIKIGGLIVESVAERVGTGTRYFSSIYFGPVPYNIDIVRTFNFSNNVSNRLLQAPFSLETRPVKVGSGPLGITQTDLVQEHDLDCENNNDAQKLVKPGKNVSTEIIKSRRENGFTSLIIPAPEIDVETLVMDLIPFLAYGAPFVIYHQYLQSLATCMRKLQTLRSAIGLQINEPWLGEYHQVLFVKEIHTCK